MLTHLKLSDFKQHADLDIAFTPGLNTIVGPNYAGKSTVLYGILWCLGGTTYVPGGADELVRHGAISVKGELGMSMHDSQYRIVRKKSTCEVFKNDESVAKGTTACSRYIEDNILEIPMRKFAQTRYAEQKKTEAMLTQGVTKLHAMIEELGGIQMVNYVLDLCGSTLQTAEAQLEVLVTVSTDEIETTIEGLGKQMIDLRVSATSLKDERTAMDAVITILEAEVDKVKADNDAATEHNEGLKKHTDALPRLKAEIAARQGTAEQVLMGALDLKTLDDTAKEGQKWLEDQASNRQHLLSMEEQVSDAELGALKAQGEIKTLTESVADKEPEDCEPLVQTIARLSDTIRDTKARLTVVTSSIESGVCPECKRPFEGFDEENALREQEKLNAVLLSMPEEKSTHQHKLDAALERNRLLKTDVDALDDATKELTALHARAESVTEEIQHFMDSVASPDEVEVGRLNVARMGQKHAKETNLRATVIEARNAIRERKAEIATIESRIKEYGAEKPLVDVSDKSKELGNLRVEMSDIKGRMAALKEKYTGVFNEHTGAKSQLEKAEADIERSKSIEARRDTAKGLQKYLRANRDRFLREIWAGIMVYASQFSNSCTDSAIEEVIREKEGKFAWVTDGQQLSIGSASGAQRSIMGLGVQLALSHILPCGLHTLLLDEPTADSDQDRASAMAMLLGDSGGQVLMISHRQFDEAMSANVIELEAVA